MKRTVAQMGALLPIFALALMTTRADGQELPKDKEMGSGAAKPAAKADPAVIAKLIQQLESVDFKTRDKASKELAKLDEVPDALREAAKSADAEVARRAQIAIAVVTARVEEQAFQAMVRDLHKVELDRFVRRMVTDEKFAGDKQWEIIQAIAKAVTKEANKLGECKFEVPDFNVKTMGRLLFKGETKNPVSVGGSVVLSAGPTHCTRMPRREGTSHGESVQRIKPRTCMFLWRPASFSSRGVCVRLFDCRAQQIHVSPLRSNVCSTGICAPLQRISAREKVLAPGQVWERRKTCKGYTSKPFDGTLRVGNPARQSWPAAGSESCVCSWGEPGERSVDSEP